MLFALNGIRSRVVWHAPVVLLLAGLLACASAPTSTEIAATAELQDVQVQTDADGTVVTLTGLTEPIFNAFQQDDPARVVVDLAGVAPGSVESLLPVDDGTVREVSVTSFTDTSGLETTRVELSLDGSASYEVVSLEDRLEVHLLRDDVFDTASADDAPFESSGIDASVSGDDAWATPIAAEETASEDPVPAAIDDSLPVDAPLATVLTDVVAEAEGDGVVVNLQANGRIDGAQHFALEDPERLVVDLPGMTSTVTPERIPVGIGSVSRVRIGQHEDKVRIVVDAMDGASDFGETQIVAVPTGAVVAMGVAGFAPAIAATPVPASAPAESTDEMSWAGDAAVSAEAEAAEVGDDMAMGEDHSDVDEMASMDESITDDASTEMGSGMGEPLDAGLNRVYGVQFDSGERVDRVVVLSDAAIDYHTMSPEAGTFMVEARGATIDPEAKVRIAPELPGVVSLVSAFDQPEASQPTVRVVVQHAGGEPRVEQRGAMLLIDFPTDAGVADKLPMLEGEAAASASAKAVDQAAAADETPPAALDPSEGLEVLQEGGLIEGKQYSGRRISLDFKDVDIDDVLRLIAEVSDLNIIAGDEVQGQVTIRLVDVPWDQALDVILLTKGLGFVRVGNVLRIAPADLLQAEEEARLQERRAKEKLEDLVVKLQPVNYANVKEVEKMVKRLLTPRGSVDVDQRTNTVILKDIASVIDEATALIKAIDTQTPQVMIEAKIVEANLDFLREVGSTWAVGIQPNIDAYDPDSGLRTADSTPRGLGGDNFRFHNIPGLGAGDAGNNVSVANPITQLATGAVNLGAFILDEKFDVDLRLEAAESHGEGKVVSSPRVVTLDNRKASIEQGIAIPFQTFENGDAKLEFIDAVLRLDVTPHITSDRSIIMKIEVQRNAPDDSVPTPTGSPAIAKNEAETETLVKDGQTLVIGGIYVIRQADRETRVPYFHKVPIIGNAFKNQEIRDIRQELLVFVTPRIVVNPNEPS